MLPGTSLESTSHGAAGARADRTSAAPPSAPSPSAAPPAAAPPAAGPIAAAAPAEAGRLAGLWSHGALLAIVGTAVVLVGQVLEDVADSAPLQMLPPTLVIQRWAIVATVAYVLAVWALVERNVSRSLAAARPALQIDDEAFDGYASRMRSLPLRFDLALLGASAVLSAALFAVLRADLPVDDPVTHLSRTLPESSTAAIVVVAAYAVVGWAILRLVYGTGRLAALLGQLSRLPLRVDVFDTSDLMPFGNIALALAFAPAGVIVVLIIGLGRPTTVVGWSVLIASTTVTLLALIVPLLGIHGQMARAKLAASTTLSARIRELYESVATSLPTDPQEASRLSNATNAATQLRRTVQEMTTWPFRNTLAFGRALLIAAAPLIYTTLSELIKVFWIGALKP